MDGHKIETGRSKSRKWTAQKGSAIKYGIPAQNTRSWTERYSSQVENTRYLQLKMYDEPKYTVLCKCHLYNELQIVVFKSFFDKNQRRYTLNRSSHIFQLDRVFSGLRLRL